MSSSISLDAVTKHFAGRRDRPDGTGVTALDGVTLDIPAGEFHVIVGPSGCGKSTLLDLLAGLSSPTSGEILLDGRPVSGPGLDRGVVFQQYALLPWRTATGNIEFGLEALGIGRRERRRRAAEYLELVGLPGFADHYPHELSGGMRQRVAIARALAVDPGVLLMDEPFAAVDAQTRETLQTELLRIQRETGTTVVFITHGIDEAVVLGQRVTVLTPRPAQVATTLEITFTDRHTADDLRSTQEFGRHRHAVWSALRTDAGSAVVGVA